MCGNFPSSKQKKSKLHLLSIKRQIAFHVCVGGIEEPEGVRFGDREGNRWLQYDSSNLPLSPEQWDSQQYVEKTHWGYYSWPR